MKKNIKLSLLYVLAVTILISCKKEETVLTPTPNPTPTQITYVSIDDYFNSNALVSQVFQIDASVGGSFETTKGSTMTIPGNILVNGNGVIITGEVDVKIKEVFSTSDIMFSGIFPVSNNTFLNSGGEFFIEIKQDNQILGIAEEQFVNLEIPAQGVDQEMMFFFGDGDEDELDTLGWQPNWEGQFGNASFTFNSVDDSYSIDLDSLGWGNIDVFMYLTYFPCTFNLTGLEGLSNTNTTAFAVFENTNTVWPVGDLGWGSIIDNVITETHLGAVSMNIIVISVVDEQLYYGLLYVTPEEGVEYDIAMTAISDAELDVIIEGLP